MTETTSKVERWSYPFKVEGAEAKDPQQYYKALAKAKDGYYPLGSNGLWHGGVHFDEATGLVVGDKAEVRCIADGEVVAYRIDEVYPKSDFGSTHSVFSTGFVLVKHRLEVPVPPAPAPAPGAQPAAAAPGPSLTFFSLYMHLLDWDSYRLTPDLGRPAFWSGGTCQVKASANDKILGLRVRQGPKNSPGYGNVLTVLPRGTLVETGEEDHGWLKVVSVTPADASLPPGTGWVYKREMTAGATPNSYVIGVAAKDEMTPPQKGLAVHASANRTSATTAILPIGTQVKIGNDGANAEYQKLIEIVSGSSIPALTASSGILGYIRKSLLETKVEPAEKNTVHLLERPFPIKAGSLIGHVGKYQNHSDSAPKNLLHLEVFSCEDVKAFTEQSKPKAISLPDTGKTMVKVPKNTMLITHVQGMSATNPPKVSDAGTKTGYDLFIPVGVLEALPADKKIKVPVVMGSSTTTTLWWRLDGLLADEHGNGISGWFSEPDIKLSRHSPFEWEGFTFIEETVSNVDHLAAFLHAQESLNEEERAAYLPNVGNADDSLAKKQLYKILDKNGDSKLKPEEITEALGKAWFSQPISQMVTRYESEWQYKSEKWDALDELMGHNDSDPHKGWVEEKARIERLSWWDKLVGKHGITGDVNVQHIHPVGLLGNFYISRIRRDFDLGGLSSTYETGGRGSRTISGGAGDAGGVSYGSYQMTSQVKLADGTIINGGTVKKFVNWSGMPWTSEFTGLTPGSSAFSDKWRELVDTKGQEFIDIEHEFIKVTHFDVQIQKVITDSGIDLRYHSHTINDVVWSTAVQQGPGASIIVNAISNIGIPHEETKLYDTKLIDAIYNERGRKIVGGEKNGQLYYFSKNSIAVQEGVASRFVSEKAKAQERLTNESGY
ncbi:hypothetical protein [Pseudomonas brassicacearum]|uniref:VgrG-related protein n=1 Tax=Pseudomonas brassicacearum TaxID=930166 RepID=UPI00223B3F0E|nr:hypothetical protein [Pseudomonas brassicacearum]